jgi:hypothetical protein
MFRELTDRKLMQEESFPKPLLPSSQIQHQDSNQSSDSDFEDKRTVGKKRKRAVIKRKQERDGRCKETNSSTSSEHDDKECNKPLAWEELSADIQSVLPNGEEYSYIIQSHSKQDTKSFAGAPEFAFSAIITINLDTSEALKTWLDKMMASSLCTYRVTRGEHRPKGKRTLCKKEMHCQHCRKHFTSTQADRAAIAAAKKRRKPMCTLVRQENSVLLC